MTRLIPVQRFGDDDFQVEFEALAPVNLEEFTDAERKEFALEIQNLNDQIGLIRDEIAKINIDIDHLTNHADGIDYTVAVASGILTGLIDSFFVGKFDANISVEKIVMDFASKKAGVNFNNYAEARTWLEENCKMDHDGAYKRKPIFNKKASAPNGHTHRLDDFAHHPTPLGLLASILFQFIRIAFFVNKQGKIRPVFVKPDAKELTKILVPVVLTGVLLWLANIAEDYAEEELPDELPDGLKKLIKLIAVSPTIIKVLRCADAWFSHIMSDVGPRADGSDGKGIPGFFLSFLKEISTLIPSSNLHQAIQDLYKSGKMNFDKELVVLENLKKQAVPVLINEVIVRTFYFVRHLISEYKEHQNLNDMDWHNIVPFGNRTVERMMTIATGTFTTVDMVDALVRGAIGSGGNLALFLKEALLHINFVGLGRFAVAIVTDVSMEVKQEKLRNERLGLYSEMLNLSNAKVFYLEAGMWKTATDTQKVLNDTWTVAEGSLVRFSELWSEIEEDMDEISANISKITDDEEFTEEVLDYLI